MEISKINVNSFFLCSLRSAMSKFNKKSLLFASLCFIGISLPSCDNDDLAEQAEKTKTTEISVRDLIAVPVVVIPEVAFNAALKAQGYDDGSEKAKKSATLLAAYANEPSIRRLRAKIRSSGDTMQSFSGEVFVVVRDGTPVNGQLETTDFYVAAVKLSGQAEWTGIAEGLLSSGQFKPFFRCCNANPLDPDNLQEICIGGGGSTGGGGCGGPTASCEGVGDTLCLQPSNPTFTNFKAGTIIGTDEVGTTIGLALFNDSYCPSYDSARSGDSPFAPIECRICASIRCPEFGSGGGEKTIIRAPEGCNAIPEYCQYIISPEHVPPECGGFCPNCFQDDPCEFGTYPGSEICLPEICTQVDMICTGPPPPELQAAMELFGAANSCEFSGTSGPTEGTTCCGKGCTCQNFGGVQRCTQCYEDGTCVPIVSPELVATSTCPAGMTLGSDGNCTGLAGLVIETEEQTPAEKAAAEKAAKEKAAAEKAAAEKAAKDAKKAKQPPAGEAPKKRIVISDEQAGVITGEYSGPGSSEPKQKKTKTSIDRPDVHDLVRPPPQGTQDLPGSGGAKDNKKKKPASAGDPVSLGTGALRFSPVDLSFPGPVRLLQFQRFYDSRGVDRSTMGSNWRHNFDVRLEGITRANAPVWVPRYCLGPHRNADGEIIPLSSKFVTCIILREPDRSTLFYYESASGLYLPQAGSTETLRVLWGVPGWALRSAQGRIRVFNELGYLIEDRDRFGNGFELEYEPTPLYRLYRHYCSATGELQDEASLDLPACKVLGRLLDDIAGQNGPGLSAASGLALPEDNLTRSIAEAKAYYSWLVNRLALDHGVTGSHKLRPTRVTDDLGRELQFAYYWPASAAVVESFDDMPHAGLLQSVQGPAGTVVRFTYDSPRGYPSSLNEMFLIAVSREDTPVNTSGLLPSIPKTFRYHYQWPSPNGRSYDRYVDTIRDKYLSFYASFVGCSDDGDAKSCGFPDGSFHPGDPCWLAETAVKNYVSSVADNIIEVVFQGRTDLESRYQPDPNYPDSFDRVVAQRFGGEEVISPVAPIADPGIIVEPWRTHLPLFQIRYQSAGPEGTDGDVTDTFLPPEIKTRYPLESGHEPLVPPPACGEPGAGCIGEDSTAQQLPVCSNDEIERPPLNLSALDLESRIAVLRPSIVNSRSCRPDLTEQLRYELPGHRRLLNYFDSDATAGANVHRRIYRSRLTCTQLAEAQVGDPFHNDLMRARVAGTESDFEIALGGRDRIERDARRICMWVQEKDADGITRYSGLNYRGQSLVLAEHLEEQDDTEPRFVYTETLFNADGNVVEARRPTDGDSEWTKGAGYTAYHYDEINPSDNDGWDEWEPSYWSRRMNVTAIREVPRTGRFYYDDANHNRVSSRGRIVTITYEPLFNQVRRLSKGTIDNPDQHVTINEFDYQELSLVEGELNEVLAFLEPWGFDWLTIQALPDGSRPFDYQLIGDWQLPLQFYGESTGTIDINGDGYAGFALDPSNPLNRVKGVAIRTWIGKPGDDWLTHHTIWAPHGEPAAFHLVGGPLVLFEYYHTGAPGRAREAIYGGPNEPDGEAIGIGFKGLLARTTAFRFGGESEPTLSLDHNPCGQLAGPYQWLLPDTCDNVERELSALGLPGEVVEAVLTSTTASDTTYAGGETKSWSYQITGWPKASWVTGNGYEHTRDPDGRLHTLIDPLGSTHAFVNDAHGNRIESALTNAASVLVERTRWSYDRDGRVLTECVALDDQGCDVLSVASSSDHAVSTTRSYTPGGRVSSGTNVYGGVRSVAYNQRGLVAQVRDEAGGSVRLRRYGYTLDGDIASITHGTDATRQLSGPLDEQYEYDGLRQRISWTDTRAVTTRFAWTALGERSRHRIGGKEFGNWLSWIDWFGWFGAQPEWEEKRKYDVFGRLTERVIQNELTTLYTLSPAGNVVAEHTKGTGPVYSTYDHQGRLLWQLDPSGQERVRTRDANKRINTETNIRQGEDELRIVSSTVTRYDALARVESYREVGDQGEDATWSLRHSARGDFLSITNPFGFLRTVDRNLAGWPTAYNSQDSGLPGSTNANDYEMTLVAYYPTTRRVVVTDDRQAESSIIFNGFGDIVQQTLSAATNPESRYYDGYGRLELKEHPSGARVGYEYDDRGDLVRLRWLNHNVPLITDVLIERTFDALGRIETGTAYNPLLQTSPNLPYRIGREVAYDHLGRIRRETFQVGSSPGIGVESQWVLNANTASRTLEVLQAETRNENYDSSGRLVGLSTSTSEQTFQWLGDTYAGRTYIPTSESSELREQASFDGLGRRLLWNYDVIDNKGQPNQQINSIINSAVIRDPTGRIRSRTLSFDDAFTRWKGYLYDPADRLSDVLSKNQARGRINTSSLSNRTFTDNAIRTFARAGGPSGETLAFERNGIGSLISITDDNGTIPWASDRGEGGRLQEVTIDGQPYAISHDFAGRTTMAFDHILDYDPLDRLSAVKQENVRLESYAYTDDGRMAAVIYPNGTYDRLVYDRQQMIASYGEAGDLRWDAIWGPGQDRLVAWQRHLGGVKVSYVPLLDHRRSVVAVLAGGNVHDRADYTAGGSVIRLDPAGTSVCIATTSTTCPATSGLPFGFTSAWRSDASGLVFMRNRWYSPQLQQFVSTDPLGVTTTLDFYAYGRFDPVNLWDPSGLLDTHFTRKQPVTPPDRLPVAGIGEVGHELKEIVKNVIKEWKLILWTIAKLRVQDEKKPFKPEELPKPPGLTDIVKPDPSVEPDAPVEPHPIVKPGPIREPRPPQRPAVEPTQWPDIVSQLVNFLSPILNRAAPLFGICIPCLEESLDEDKPIDIQ